MSELCVVGKAIPRVDVLEKVTGKAQFTSDFTMPGMLHGKIVHSQYPHAWIRRIDITKAQSFPGVQTILLPEDAPDMRIGYSLVDSYVLPRDYMVRCVGQPIVVVVADTAEIAENAAALVEVDYEELPAMFDPEEALTANPPVVVHPDLRTYTSSIFPFRYDPELPNCFQLFKIKQGDVDKGFEQADLILEDRYTSSRISHCALETRAADAWVEADGTIVIRSCTQTPHTFAPIYAPLFNLPPEKIRVLTPYIGGGFGGKIGNETMLEPLAVLAALKTGRPVRLEHSRKEELECGRHRADVVVYIKDGFKRDGTLVARALKVILNAGVKADVAQVVARNISFGSVGTYKVPNFKWDGYGVYTNCPPTGAFRGFGSPDVNWAIEQQMNIAAEKLGIDPVAIRTMNMLKDGDKDVTGQTTVSFGGDRVMKAVVDWLESDPSVVREDGPWKIGKGFAIGNKYSVAIPCTARVTVDSEGRVEVCHGNVEIGQGLNTVMTMLAAEEFGISIDQVSICHGDSMITPEDHGSVSSRSTFFTGGAVRMACQAAKKRLLELASAKLGKKPEELVVTGGQVMEKGNPQTALPLRDLLSREVSRENPGEIVCDAFFHIPTSPGDPETGQADRIVAYYTHIAHAAEVAVNMQTGQMKVLRVAVAADMGQPVNPKMVEGQLEGGLQIGLGSAIYEEIILKNGKVVNSSFTDYRMQTTLDMPTNDCVKVIIDGVSHPEGPFGAKGIGEAALVTVASAIGNAFYDATGVRMHDLPMSNERVLKAIQTKAETGSGS